jgi:anaerobic magnesium-protoporphyrin IX monomethyl ester cyclase
MKVLLVDANTAWLARGQDPGLRQVVLPLGLMYLSSAVKAVFGSRVEIKLINTAIDCLDAGSFEDAVRRFGPDLVGIRALSVARAFFEEISRVVRAVAPGATIVAGGPYPSDQPEEVLRSTPVDWVVRGEGERTFVQLLERLMAGQRPGDLRGLAFRQGSQVVVNPAADFIADLNALPRPDYDAIAQEKYAAVLSYGYTQRRQGMILSSRGCSFSCKYCFKFMGDRFRPRSPESVVDEVAWLQEVHGIRDILFVDDSFNLNPRRAHDIFSAILARNLRCNFYFPAGLRAELMSTDMVDLLVEAGTCWITYAVETVVPRLQELSGRLGDAQKAAVVIDHTTAKRIMVGLFFMVGFPTETLAEAELTLRYVRERRRLTMPFFFAVRYFPRTELTHLALASGAINPAMLSAANRSYHDVSQCETSTISKAGFEHLYASYLRDILLDPERLRFALSVQEQFLSSAELAAVYGLLLGRRIHDPYRVFRHLLGDRVREHRS